MKKLPFQRKTSVNLLPLNLMVSPYRIQIVTLNLGCRAPRVWKVKG